MKRLLFIGFLLMPFLLEGQVVDTAAARREVDSLVQVCRGLTGEGKYEEALEVIEVAKKRAEEGFGVESAEYAKCVFNHGKVFHLWRKFTEAEQSYLIGKDILEKILKRESSIYASTLYNLGSIYYEKGAYAKSEPLFFESANIREKIFGKNHLDYAASLNNLANVYWARGEYDKAISLHIETKDIREKLLGKPHPDYAASLNNLAGIYMDKLEYNKAELLFLESKTIREKSLGQENPAYAASLNNLGALYKEKGDFRKAELFFLEDRRIREKTLGKDHPDYARSLRSLANMYKMEGEYDKAEQFLREAKSIFEKTSNTEHPDYAWNLINLASVYSNKGEFDQAIQILTRAKSILEKVLGKDHSDYASCIDILAIAYKDKVEYSKAESLHKEAKAIREKLLGKEHLLYAQSLNNLAIVYKEKGEYDQAESLYLESKDILEKILGKNHPLYATSLNNLAIVYKEKGQYDKAEPLYLESKKIRETIFGNKNPEFAASLNNLTMFYWFKKEKNKTLSNALSSNILNNYLLQNATTFLSEKEMLQYWELFKNRFDVFYSLSQICQADSLSIAAFNNMLLLNNVMLFSAITREKNLIQSDSITRSIYSEIKTCYFQLSKQYARSVINRDSAVVERLEEKVNQYEKELVRRSQIFAEAQREVQWSDVRDALQPNQAAIEIIHYRYYDKKITDSTIYAALILTPNDTAPHFIPLCEERQLDALIYKPNGTRANYLQNLYSAPRTDGLTSLYQLIWAPIDKVLKENGIKTVYYAPSGLLHRLNLAAIAPDKTGQTLADQYHLVPVASTRQLVTDHSEVSTPTSAIIYGGVRYEMDSTAIVRANKDLSATAQDTTGGLFRYAVRGGERADNWDTLPGTKREAKYLYELLTKRGVNATLRLGYAATEESLKQIGQNGPSPSLLHIGTHGFFFPDPKDTTRRRANFGEEAPVFKISEHPLIRSGLKLAGSKYAWENKRPMGGMEDGILTAYEVSQMNLSNTQLVVLSACETGLGDIKGNEGVYGLQRAFRIAGAKNVLMSLWKVPDEATEKLMTRFYTNWLEQKLPLRTAFESAQKWLRGQKGYENPYYWAGFVLVGEL